MSVADLSADADARSQELMAIEAIYPENLFIGGEEVRLGLSDFGKLWIMDFNEMLCISNAMV